MSTTREITPAVTPWAPLRRRIFRRSVDGAIRVQYRHVDAERRRGLAHDHAEAVAAVRRAGPDRHLPAIFVVGLAAGALADILDLRRYLLVTQVWMLIAAATLGITTTLGGTTPGSCWRSRSRWASARR